MTTSEGDDRVEVGRYWIVGEPGKYRIMERDGSYRMLRKVFKTFGAASSRATELNAAIDREQDDQ